MAHAREWVAQSAEGVAVELIHEDDGRGNTHALRHVQDVEPILDANQRLRGHQQVGTKHMQAVLAARVPAVTMYHHWPAEFQREHGVHPHHPDLSNVPAHERSSARRQIRDAWDRWRRTRLNSSDYSKFRVDTRKL